MLYLFARSWGSQGKNTEVFHSLLQWTSLSGLSTMTRPSWVALHGLAHSFIELDKAVVHVISWLVFCDCGFHYVCPLMNKGKRLTETA